MTTAIAKQGQTVRDLIMKAKPQLAEVLPKHLTPERLIRIASAALNRTPALAQCSAQSVLLSVMNAAQLGLEPGGADQRAYLVPFKDECQLIVSYRGLIDLARRSGKIKSIEARVVREGDSFAVAYGLNPRLEHSPSLTQSEPGEVVAVYAIARFDDGGTQLEIMTRAEVDAIRKRSRSGGSGPWSTDYSEMARKTVVKRLCKYLPMSIEMARAIELDTQAEIGERQAPDQDVVDALGVVVDEPAANPIEALVGEPSLYDQVVQAAAKAGSAKFADACRALGTTPAEISRETGDDILLDLIRRMS